MGVGGGVGVADEVQAEVQAEIVKVSSERENINL
jgi:hypothetical protein